MEHKDDRAAVIQLLTDTEVLTPLEAQRVRHAQPETLLFHLRKRDALQLEDEKEAQNALNTLFEGGSPTAHLDAKLALVRLITKNVHRRIEKQEQETHAQKERITREEVPQVTRPLKNVRKVNLDA